MKTTKQNDGVRHEKLRKKAFQNPEVAAEYEFFKLHFELADQMKNMRKNSGLTRIEVAKKMNTTKKAVTKLEIAANVASESPTLAILQKYARAIGCIVKIKLIPEEDKNESTSG